MEIASLGDSLDEGVVIVDRDGNVAYANRRANELLGHDTLATGIALASLSHFHLSRLVDRARESGGEETIDTLEIGNNLLHCAAAPLPDGTISLLLRDDSRVHHLETVRRDFVANVSHELRTPITAISLIVDTLNNGAADDPAAAAEFIRRIGLEVSSLNQMVEELLALSRMELGNDDDLQRDEIPIASIVAGLRRLQPLLDAKGQSLQLDIADDTPSIQGNARLLEQLFRNLVHNASKYSPDGSTITLQAASASEATVVIRVIDQGMGIAPEDLPRVFERFWKADRSRQRDGEGSGLGLAIAKHAVEVHGGVITAQSEPQHGATFIVTLPVVAPTATLPL